ncbi:membrane protein [Oceaniferula spumae]|uniref:Membrane protein n=1 Tax=Oceaniferula spumae TaxID=2979115 RepID=A0AAT9FGG1_9BACT
MAKKNSLINELILAPWWVSVCLAGIIYVGGNILSGITSSNLGFTMVATVAGAVTPIFTIVFLFVALISFFRSFKTKAQLKRQESIETLNELSWKDFENVTGELFRQRGYKVEEMLGGGADGGVDLRLRRDGQLTLVQCKQWKNKNVGLPIIRELLGAMTAESADKGILVTTSTFTSEAGSFAMPHGIKLINGDQLSQEITGLNPPSAAPNFAPVSAQPNSSTPACPKCSQPMAIRTAKRGTNSGTQFWGCSSYPKCRGTMSI